MFVISNISKYNNKKVWHIQNIYNSIAIALTLIFKIKKTNLQLDYKKNFF